MNIKSRRGKPSFVAHVISVAALAAFSSVAGAAGNAPENAFRNSARVSDASLPPQAMRGTGIAGAFNPTAIDAASVALTLADGRKIEARVQRMSIDNAKGRKTWVGTFADQPGSLLVMTTFRGATTGFATYGNETWEFVPAKAGGHVMYRVDESKFQKAEKMLYTNATAADVASTSATGAATTDATAGGYVQDVLVVYTAKSRARWGQATLESMIQNAVQAANQAYLNSKVGITLNLVGLQEIAYTETGDLSTSVYDLKGTTDGKMDDVHALRDKVGADLVALVSEDTSACGIAFTMRTVSTSHASSAFGVVQSTCLSQHSLAHELGHIQGNQHDRVSSTNTGAFAYSYGYRVCDKADGTGWRDVMSYPCNGATRVTQFSNPSVYYNGYATGIAYESDPANSADTARSMNNTASTVAAFKGATSTTAPTAPTATAPVAPSSAVAKATSSSSVTLTWADNSANETGFKVERSTDGVVFSEVASLGAGTTAYANSGLTAKTYYYFRVRAYNSVGNSAYSNAASVQTPDAAPAAPTAIAALNDADGTATVKWTDASSNESSFEVRRETWDSRKSTWGAGTTVASVPSGYSSIVDMSGSGTYRYSVRAVNAGGASAFAGPAQTTVTGGSNRGKRR